MRLNKLPPDIVKCLPSPGPGYLTPELLERLSRPDRRKLLRLVPQEKFEAMVETAIGWIDQGQFAEKMTTDAWERRLQASVRPALLDGKLSVMQVVAAAERCQAIDLELRKILVAGDLPADIAALPALQAYKDRALLRNITVDLQGFGGNYARDYGITVLMTLAGVRWPNVPEWVRPKSRKPSASKVVGAALNHCKITNNLTPDAIVKIFNNHDQALVRMMSRLESMISV